MAENKTKTPGLGNRKQKTMMIGEEGRTSRRGDRWIYLGQEDGMEAEGLMGMTDNDNLGRKHKICQRRGERANW